MTMAPPFIPALASPVSVEEELKRKAEAEGLTIADLENQGPPPKLTVVRFGEYYPSYLKFPYLFGMARFALSGRLIAGLEFGGKLRLVNIAGVELAALPGRILDVVALSVSRDGGRIAFSGSYTRFEAASPDPAWDPANRVLGILVVPTASKDIVQVRRFERAEDRYRCKELSWAPDGSQLAYEWDGEVFVYHVATAATRHLVAGHLPSWSPDGRWIAYQATNKQLNLITPDGGKNRPLLAGREVLGGLRWSPDSEYLAFGEKHFFRPLHISSRLVVVRLKDEATLPVRDSGDSGIGRDQGWIYLR